MRKALIAMTALAAVLILAWPVLADEGQGKDYSYGYNCPGAGQGWGGRGPGMMGGGYGGYGMMGGGGYGGRGPGMMGGGYGPGGGAGQGLKPEELQELRKAWADYLKDTLAIRQQLAAKQMELQTLWVQPEADQTRVSQLSEEVADLRAQLAKKSDAFTLQCRQRYGDRGWSCPGAAW